MREERGKLTGDVVVEELYTLWGMIIGNVRVVEGGKLYVRGSIYGNLTVEAGGRAHIFGNLQGKLTVHRAAKVIHSGIIGGDILNRGGRIFIEPVAKVSGKIKTRSGETYGETQL